MADTNSNFETLVAAHGAEIFAYLWRMVRDEADAQDCLQEAFLRAYRAYDRLDGQANQRAWLYRIATNVALTHLKRQGREAARRVPPLVPDLRADDPSPDETAIRRERLEAAAAAVERLPQHQRAALVLRKYQALSYAEIAETLECSEAAARANVYQAIKKLRSELGEA